jgi:hypothetical protein
VAFAAITLAGQGAAWSRQIAAQLDYVAAPGCPVAGDFEAVVAGRLGYSPFRASAPERVVVRIDASGRTLEGHVEWRNETGAWAGERTFPSRSGDCGELARAMGFALALQFQLLASADPSPPPAPPPAPAPPPPAAALPPPAAAPPRPPTVAREPAEVARDAVGSGPAIAIGAGAAAAVGLSPSAIVLGRVFGGAAWSRISLEVAAEVSIPSTTTQPNGWGFSQQVLLASVAGCGRSGRVTGCVLADAGQIRVTGQGLMFPATDAGLLVHGGLRVGVAQPLGRYLLIAAHGDVLVSLTRGIVHLDRAPVWTTPRVGALLGLDFGVRFP